MMNGYPTQQSSPSSHPPSSPYRPRQIQSNGFYQQYPQAAGISQQRSPSSGPDQRPISSHQFPQYVPGYPTHQSTHGVGNGLARSPPPRPDAHHTPSQNGASHQPQSYPYQQRPLASANVIPRQPTQSPAHGRTANNTGRLPSPVFNRPMMSPTQGNMDVGPVAGFPQQSPSLGQDAMNGLSVNGFQPRQNGVTTQVHATPRASSQPQEAQTPTTQPISGLSPQKQPTPQHFPPPSIIPQKRNSMSPTLPPNAMAGGHVEKRTISGTPVLPPIENLRPSPEQLRKMSSNEPVPTPSKQPQPSPTMAGVENGDFANCSSSPPDKMENVQLVTGAEVKTS